jgi:hypothetical protein
MLRYAARMADRRITVTLPEELAARIEAAAEAAQRAVAAEIRLTLLNAYPAPGTGQQDDQAVHDALSSVKPRAHGQRRRGR